MLRNMGCRPSVMDGQRSGSERQRASQGGRLGARRLSTKAVCEIVKAYADRVG
jgi:hypothetical protein